MTRTPDMKALSRTCTFVHELDRWFASERMFAVGPVAVSSGRLQSMLCSVHGACYNKAVRIKVMPSLLPAHISVSSGNWDGRSAMTLKELCGSTDSSNASWADASASLQKRSC